MLINGGGRFICSMAVPARPVECVDIQESEMKGILAADLIKSPMRLRIANVGYVNHSKLHTCNKSNVALVP
jgi:hypothetical protein